MRLFRAHAPSLERPLLLRLSALYIFAFIGTSMGYLALGWDDRRTEIAQMMGQLAEEIGAAVTVDAGGQPHFRPNENLAARISRFGDRGVVVTDLATNQQITGPDGFEVPSINSAAEPLDGEFAFLSPRGRWRYAAFRTVPNPHCPFNNIRGRQCAFRVTVVKSDNPMLDVLVWARHELMDETLPTFVPMLIATLLITWLTVRRVLRPLHAVSAEARAIGVGGGETRIRTATVPQEILPVVAAANAALARLGEALRQQQRFTASAAHELRTPLAVLRARVESSVGPAAAPALLNDIDRLGRTVDQLLTMARFEARQMPLDDKVDVVAIARDCIARIVPLVLAAGKDIVLDVPERRALTLRGNGDVVERAICNLVENAVRFTPPGSEVVVRVGPGVVVEVRDHGPGIDPAMRELLFKPFVRGAVGGGAAGLGLAIVAEAAAMHGGHVSAQTHPDGGAVFRLVLPQMGSAGGAILRAEEERYIEHRAPAVAERGGR